MNETQRLPAQRGVCQIIATNYCDRKPLRNNYLKCTGQTFILPVFKGCFKSAQIIIGIPTTAGNTQKNN